MWLVMEANSIYNTGLYKKVKVIRKEEPMLKEDIIEFFDKCALEWDNEMIRDDKIINMILDNARVEAGKDILDVACGTGVLIPDYLARNVKSVTAVDISQNMVRITESKFRQENVKVICADVETAKFEHKFDCVVVYNAFPHFSEPEKLIRILTSHLKEGGILTVAHGMSREKIDKCHKGAASKVSNGLMSEQELAEIFGKYLSVVAKISNEEMYQVVGCLHN